MSSLTRYISIINRCSALTDADIEPVIPALQTQVSRDFAPIWGPDVELTYVPRHKRAPNKTWWIVLLDTSDDAGFLGYHDMSHNGLPLGKVFVKSDLDAGSSWSSTISHELLEMLGDPDLNPLRRSDAPRRARQINGHVADRL